MMRRATLLLVLLAALLPEAFATARDARPLQVAEPAVALQPDFDAMHARLDAIGARGPSDRPWDAYHLAKARAWLDFAFDARAQRDAGGAVDAALAQVQALAMQLEAGAPDISLETPLIVGAARLREDIWERAEAMKRQDGRRCAAARIAQFEVQLVQAGHAHELLGWRHARPYLQVVERLAKDADARLQACPAPVQSVAELPPEVVQQPSPKEQVELLALRVHFAFDRSELDGAAAAVLAQLAFVMREHPELRVELQGHADRRGSNAYNDRLSRARAASVRDFLVAAGISESRLVLRALGKAMPLIDGQGEREFALNRRVEFIVLAPTEPGAPALVQALPAPTAQPQRVER